MRGSFFFCQCEEIWAESLKKESFTTRGVDHFSTKGGKQTFLVVLQRAQTAESCRLSSKFRQSIAPSRAPVRRERTNTSGWVSSPRSPSALLSPLSGESLTSLLEDLVTANLGDAGHFGWLLGRHLGTWFVGRFQPSEKNAVDRWRGRKPFGGVPCYETGHVFPPYLAGFCKGINGFVPGFPDICRPCGFSPLRSRPLRNNGTGEVGIGEEFSSAPSQLTATKGATTGVSCQPTTGGVGPWGGG